MSKMCPKCGNRVFGSADLYCYIDGEKAIEVDENCQCGRELDPQDRFCPRCGRKKVGVSKESNDPKRP